MSDLEQAKAELADAEERLKRLREQWESYSGSTNRYPFAMKAARRDVSIAKDRLAAVEGKKPRRSA